MWRRYGSINNAVFAAALVIAASWVWGSVSTMQTNFAAQKAVNDQQQQLELTQLEVDTLKFQQNYYRSDEYKELAARANLGLALPGEKVLILPPNSEAVKQQDTQAPELAADTPKRPAASNFEQWMAFLMGDNVEKVSDI